MSALGERFSALRAHCSALVALPAIESDRRLAGYAERMARASHALCTDPATTQSDRDARHRLRNELNRLSGPCQLLARAADDPAAAALLAQVSTLVEDCVRMLADESAVAAPPPVAAGSVTVAAAGGPARILVAEDDADNRRFLQEVLAAANYEVVTVAAGDAALGLVEAGDVDVLLLDLGLPGLNGIEVLQRLQKDGWLIPVIVVTGQGGVDEAVRCIEHGADDFLTKPIQLEILRARVASCVEKARLREREFGQFFPPKLARSFARRPALINEMPPRHAEVSVLFCDIRHFSAITEQLGPEETTRWLRGVMHELSECVIANEGVLVDFAGDELMAMWGAPDASPDHAARACDTAVDMLLRLPALSAQWESQIGAPTELAIGVSSGTALVGHIGTARKTKYGPLGDVVNLGARVLGATRYLRTRLLLTGATRSALGADWSRGHLRRLSRARVKNLAQPVDLYELRPAADSGMQPAFFSDYEAALSQFEARAFEQAAAILGQVLLESPGDGPALTLMARVVDALLKDDHEFDPVWRLDRL